MKFSATGMTLGHWTLEDLFTEYVIENERHTKTNIIHGSEQSKLELFGGLHGARCGDGSVDMSYTIRRTT
jgi:hypothetical protein